MLVLIRARSQVKCPTTHNGQKCRMRQVLRSIRAGIVPLATRSALESCEGLFNRSTGSVESPALPPSDQIRDLIRTERALFRRPGHFA